MVNRFDLDRGVRKKVFRLVHGGLKAVTAGGRGVKGAAVLGVGNIQTGNIQTSTRDGTQALYRSLHRSVDILDPGSG